MTLPWYLTAIILGLVEGATEFIPVSSTGHLIVVSDWLGFTGDRADTFVVFIQLGAILAIVWQYREMLARVAVGWRRDAGSRGFLLNIAVGFFPAAVAGLVLHKTIKAYLFNPAAVALALVVGGLLILLIERWRPVTRVQHVEDIGWRLALGVGLAQMLALVPGVSRSGATIMGGYSLGLSRKAATEFSFFLAIPLLGAATVYDLLGSLDVLTVADAQMLGVGLVVSFVSALIVVRAFLAYVAHNTFRGFAYYRIGFGLLVLAWYTAP